MDFNEALKKARGTTTKLKDLRITRVDLVAHGANVDKKSGLGSHVMIFKSVESEPPSHEGQPEEAMQESQVERIAAEFTKASVEYGAALAKIFTADPASYAAYRERNFR